MQINPSSICLLLMTSGAACTLWLPVAHAESQACDYPMVQQQFNLASTGLDGCHRLDSVARIFGEASTSSSSVGRFAATRFAAANLVFVGRAVGRRGGKAGDEATADVEVEVEVDCYLKGRLPDGRVMVRVGGFGQSLEGAVCRGVQVEPGRRAVFFATAASAAAAGADADGVAVRVNENGVETDVNGALAGLGCRENRGLVDNDCGGRVGSWMSAECRVTVAAALQLLARLRDSPDLRPECRGAPLHREAFKLEGKAGTATVSSGDGGNSYMLLLMLSRFAAFACLHFVPRGM